MAKSIFRLWSTVCKNVYNFSSRRFADYSRIDEDQLSLYLCAGRGGNGLARYNGIGGDGGDIYIMADPSVRFSQVKKFLGNSLKVCAARGEHSSQIKLIGEKGKDEVIRVPVGVEVVETKTRTLLARCSSPKEKIIIALGGKGGSKENNYIGSLGEHFMLELNFKLRPNIGLVGFPNAGKSTLMRALVQKKNIKIASYPFTTKVPQICNMKGYENDSATFPYTLSIADLPGLIEGASMNRGRGLSFLKHLEYCDIILMVVDIKGFQLQATLNEPFRSPLETVALLNVEMEKYDPRLVKKPTILAINKIDLLNGFEVVEELMRILKSPNWTNSVSEDIRPHEPICFDALVPISAKKDRLNGLKKVLKSTHDFLFPLTGISFRESMKTINKFI
ncbi:unnamed protein product [Dracunculus medinensis]|uniref:OBG-type G domain-containing protein n=1 Tax=Dracunculus medinensis TaxID=318479 RepID=A0A0N4U3Q0_DRAME|nr:unnamed protein product [Dracunculus medinensis]